MPILKTTLTDSFDSALRQRKWHAAFRPPICGRRLRHRKSSPARFR
jgi:hypothetical protein